jgi:hypothetical protein
MITDLLLLAGIGYVIYQLEIIIMTQAEFDAQITRANEAIAAVGAAVAAEAQQIRDYIDANPSVDTTALTGVVDTLEGLATSVGDIFTPPVDEEPVPEPEPEPES